MADATVVVDFVANTKGLSKGADDAAKATSGLGSKLAGMGKAALLSAGAAGIGALALGAKSAIDAASNLNESVNAVNVTFGKAAGTVLDFSGKAAKQAGLSMQQFNEQVVPVGASLQNLGFSQKQAATTSVDLAKRAADMASVFNTSVPDALEAIQAGLRGEADPLERFGVGLSASAVQQQALAMHLGKTTKELTAQDLAQARVALLMKQTNKFAGDFVNTSGGLANSQRILSAEFQNVQAKIGQFLLPMMVKAVGFIKDNWPQAQVVIVNVFNAIKPVLVAIGALFVQVVELIRSHWDTIGPILDQVKVALSNALKVIQDVVKLVTALLKGDWDAAWQAFKQIVTDVIAEVKALLTAELLAYQAILGAAWTAIKAAASAAWGLIKQGINAALEAIKAAIVAELNAYKSLLLAGWNAIKSAVVTSWDAIKGAIDTAWNAIKSAVASALAALKTQVTNSFNAWKGIVQTAIDAVVGVVESLPGKLKKLKDDFASAGSALGGAVASAINSALTAVGSGAAGVLRAAINSLIRTLNSGLNVLVDHWPNVPGAPGPPFGHNPIPTLAKGGVLTRPTLFIGGESGREIVTPEKLLRDILREERGGGDYTMNVYPRTADAADIAWGFRRLELLRTGR